MELKVSIIPDAIDEDGLPVFTSIQEAIVNSITEQTKTLAEKLAKQLVQSKIASMIDDYATNRVEQEVDRVLAGPIPQTSKYGEPKSEPTTITEIIVAAVQKYLGAKVNSRGEVSYDGKNSPISLVVETVAKDVLSKEVIEQTKEIRAELIRSIAEKLSGKL